MVDRCGIIKFGRHIRDETGDIMAVHEFGIMEIPPAGGERYDTYEPKKYGCISVDDEYIEPIVPKTHDIKMYWHSLDMSGGGLDYCGITLIPPEASERLIEIIDGIPQLSELKMLLAEAADKDKFVIHYGL